MRMIAENQAQTTKWQLFAHALDGCPKGLNDDGVGARAVCVVKSPDNIRGREGWLGSRGGHLHPAQRVDLA